MNGENVEREKTNFNLQKKEAPDLPRSSLKRLENLVSLLEELSSRNDPSPDLLLKFIKLYLELPLNEKPLLFQKLISDLEVHICWTRYIHKTRHLMKKRMLFEYNFWKEVTT